jgi:hypothetical protein
MRTLKIDYIELIKKVSLADIVKITLDNLDEAELVESERGMEVLNEHGTQFALEQLSLQEILSFCFELEIEPRMDYLILSEDNQWLGTGKFATQSEIDTHIEDIINDYDEDRPNLVVFTAREMNSFNI